MPMMFPCSKGSMCPYNGYTTKPLDVCDQCKADEKRSQERYENEMNKLTSKDSRVTRRKGWKK